MGVNLFIEKLLSTSCLLFGSVYTSSYTSIPVLYRVHSADGWELGGRGGMNQVTSARM